MNFILNLIILLSLFYQIECQSSVEGCSQRDKENMDLIMSKIITIGKTGRKFPETVEQGPAYCKYEYFKINYLN